MAAAALSLLESFSALADPTRCRMLLILERHELTVSELCLVLQLPQSTVSRHLKMLTDAELLASRREGTSRYYSLALGAPATPKTSNLELQTSSLWRQQAPARFEHMTRQRRSSRSESC